MYECRVADSVGGIHVIGLLLSTVRWKSVGVMVSLAYRVSSGVSCLLSWCHMVPGVYLGISLNVLGDSCHLIASPRMICEMVNR